MTTLYIPTVDFDTARRIAHAVVAGRLPMQAHFASRSAACARAAALNEQHGRVHGHEPVKVIEIEIVTATTHDGRIPIARLGLGDVAAALLLVTLAPMAAAAGWGILS